MDDFVMPLPLPLDVVSLTMGLVNIGSVSGAEGPVADSVEQALRTQPHLTVERLGDTVVARTDLGLPERVVLAGHLDTVPGDGDGDSEPMASVEMGRLSGLGACDAKGGLAVMLKSAALPAYGRDVTFVFHAGAESDSPDLDRLARDRPELLRGDLAVVVEPTDARAETLDADAATVAAFAELVGSEPVPAVDRTAVRTFAGLGVPALAFGPGDPRLAHTREEFVPTAQLTECEHVLREWLRPR